MRLSEIADQIGGEVIGQGDFEVRDVADYAAAASDLLSCADSPQRMERPTAAGALIVPPGVDPGRPGIRCENPLLGFARAVELFRPVEAPPPGIHSTAQIAEDARLGEGVRVEAHASVGPGSEIGEGSRIGAGARLGEGVRLGPACVIHPNVVLYPGVSLGARVVVHAGAVIGSDGFGYVPDGSGALVKFPQRGTVVIEDDVEIGANATIDRAALAETRIGRGTKIDNIVQIAHTVTIGENCALAGLVGISGSVRIGSGVLIGGQAGVADHVEIGDGARIAGKTGVTKSLEGGKTYMDTPAAERAEAGRRVAAYRRLPSLFRRVSALEEKLKDPGA